MSTWKYDIIEIDEGYQIVENFGFSYAVLDGPRELWAETKTELVEMLERMIRDIKDKQ